MFLSATARGKTGSRRAAGGNRDDARRRPVLPLAVAERNMMGLLSAEALSCAIGKRKRFSGEQSHHVSLRNSQRKNGPPTSVVTIPTGSSAAARFSSGCCGEKHDGIALR